MDWNALSRTVSQILRHEPFSQQFEISFFEVKVRPADHFLAFFGYDPIDYLRCVGAQEIAVLFVERFAVFAGENPDVSEAAVADVLEVFFKAG